MTVRVYRSTDVGAPTIGRTIGSLITLLDAVLVNGYGSKSPLGWTKQFSGTNVAMYLQGTGSSGCTLYVSHTTADSASAFGLVNPTSISDTSKNKFWSSSYPISIAAPENKWVVVGNEKAFYLLTSWSTWGSLWSSFFFGDISAYGGTSDLYRCLITGATSTPSISSPGTDVLSNATNDYTFTVQNGPAMAGQKSDVGSVLCGVKHIAFAQQSANPFPNKYSGGITLYPRWVYTALDVRGEMPGCYAPHQPLQQYSIPSGTLVGEGPMAGKQFELFMIGPSYSVIALETSDTWSN